MGTRTLPVTAASFEKLFAAVASRRRLRRKSPSGSEHAATWRETAWEALERNELGDTLRRAIQVLSVKCREVLFLQDVKNLSTTETAWVLGITVGAVRSRLLRARTTVRNALASGLPSKQECFGARLKQSRRIAANLALEREPRVAFSHLVTALELPSPPRGAPEGGPSYARIQRIHRIDGRSPQHARKVCRALTDRGVNILALQSFAIGGKSLTRFIVDNPTTAKTVLNTEQLTYVETDIVQVKLPHRRGEIARVASPL